MHTQRTYIYTKTLRPAGFPRHCGSRRPKDDGDDGDWDDEDWCARIVSFRHCRPVARRSLAPVFPLRGRAPNRVRDARVRTTTVFRLTFSSCCLFYKRDRPRDPSCRHAGSYTDSYRSRKNAQNVTTTACTTNGVVIPRRVRAHTVFAPTVSSNVRAAHGLSTRTRIDRTIELSVVAKQNETKRRFLPSGSPTYMYYYANACFRTRDVTFDFVFFVFFLYTSRTKRHRSSTNDLHNFRGHARKRDACASVFPLSGFLFIFSPPLPQAQRRICRDRVRRGRRRIKKKIFFNFF